MPLQADLLSRVARDFATQDAEPAIASLEALRAQNQRVVRCAFTCRKGFLERLHHFLRTAEVAAEPERYTP